MRSIGHQGTVAVYNEKQSFLYAVLRVYHNFFCPVTPWRSEREQVSGCVGQVHGTSSGFIPCSLTA